MGEAEEMLWDEVLEESRQSQVALLQLHLPCLVSLSSVHALDSANRQIRQETWC